MTWRKRRSESARVSVVGLLVSVLVVVGGALHGAPRVFVISQRESSFHST